jgi:uncharacterized membrane protein
MQFILFVKGRKRWLFALLVSLLTGLLLVPPSIRPVTRALIGWNVGVACYLLSVWWMMLRAEPRRIRLMADQQDETAYVVLTVTILAAVASVVAIVLELADTQGLSGLRGAGRMALTGATIVGTWLLIPTMFAAHYAHEYYLAPPNKRPLDFPDAPPQPQYLDFLYFAFTIGVASQTADVCLHSSAMRRDVLVQSVLSFFFNASILGLTINIAASLVHP